MNVIPQPQQFTVDWNKVVQNSLTSVQYGVDTDTNGSYETLTYLKPVFQDLVAPTSTAILNGTILPTTTSTYIESVNITLNSQDNTSGSGVYKTYFTLDNYYPQYTEYT